MIGLLCVLVYPMVLLFCGLVWLVTAIRIRGDLRRHADGEGVYELDRLQTWNALGLVAAVIGGLLSMIPMALAAGFAIDDPTFSSDALTVALVVCAVPGLYGMGLAAAGMLMWGTASTALEEMRGRPV